MATRTVLTSLTWVLLSPLIILSWLLENLKVNWFMTELDQCSLAISESESIPDRFVQILVIAEDHRNDIHPGIDPIAILRAVYVRITTGAVQGASTIEQQFVRVVSGRYELTLRRKVREQLLALSVARQNSKFAIATAYLNIAFYGTAHVSFDDLIKKHRVLLNDVDDRAIIRIVARLKYPEPITSTIRWNSRIDRRVAYIEHRARTAANNKIKKEAVLRDCSYY